MVSLAAAAGLKIPGDYQKRRKDFLPQFKLVAHFLAMKSQKYQQEIEKEKKKLELALTWRSLKTKVSCSFPCHEEPKISAENQIREEKTRAGQSLAGGA